MGVLHRLVEDASLSLIMALLLAIMHAYSKYLRRGWEDGQPVMKENGSCPLAQPHSFKFDASNLLAWTSLDLPHDIGTQRDTVYAKPYVVENRENRRRQQWLHGCTQFTTNASGGILIIVEVSGGDATRRSLQCIHTK